MTLPSVKACKVYPGADSCSDRSPFRFKKTKKVLDAYNTCPHVSMDIKQETYEHHQFSRDVRHRALTD